MRPLLGILFPESILYSPWFSLLAAFVAINTVMYVTLATMKILPVIRPQEWFQRGYVRSQTRSIYPDAIEGPQAREAGRQAVEATAAEKVRGA